MRSKSLDLDPGKAQFKKKKIHFFISLAHQYLSTVKKSEWAL